MSAFNRHRKNYRPEKKMPDGGPTAGTIAWLLWGGTSGVNWAKKKSATMNAEDEYDPSMPSNTWGKDIVGFEDMPHIIYGEYFYEDISVPEEVWNRNKEEEDYPDWDPEEFGIKNEEEVFDAELVMSRFSPEGYSLYGRKLHLYGRLQGAIVGGQVGVRNNPEKTYTGRYGVRWGSFTEGTPERAIFDKVSQEMKPESFEQWMDVIYATNDRLKEPQKKKSRFGRKKKAETFEAVVLHQGKLPEGAVAKAMLTHAMMEKAKMLETIAQLENSISLGLISEEEVMRSLKDKFGAETVDLLTCGNCGNEDDAEVFNECVYCSKQMCNQCGDYIGDCTGCGVAYCYDDSGCEDCGEVCKMCECDCIDKAGAESFGAETQDFAPRYEIQIRTSRGNVTERIPVSAGMLVRRVREILARKGYLYAMDIFGTEPAFNVQGPYGMQVYRPKPKLMAVYKYGRFESGEMADHLNEKLGLR